MPLLAYIDSEDGSREVYDSTQRLVRFAIREMNASFARHVGSHDSVTQWLNHLLPVELRDMNYKPARRIMENWASVFFSNRSRKGLIPNLAIRTDRRAAVPDGFYTSTVDMIQRM